MIELERERLDNAVESWPAAGWRFLATICAALGAVVADVLFPAYQPMPALIGLVALLCLNEGRLPTLGLRLTPIQGWGYWCRMTIKMAVLVAIVLALCAGIALALGWSIPAHRTNPARFLPMFYFMCIYAPISEEVVYRSLLAAACFPMVGSGGTILVSGLVFALIHILGGNASPENQIGGFLLSWAFLRSGSILVPIAIHSVGNLAALVAQFAAWCWLPDIV
jgi:membrane protease YdiL (CAAX protease family)